MKYIYTILLFFVIGIKVMSNPIAVPEIHISELFFDDLGNWKIELEYLNIEQNEFTFDSIFISSSTHAAKLPDYKLSDNLGFIVITNDSLMSDFKINQQGDTIKVVYYCSWIGKMEDILIYGDCQGASISQPRLGQSLSKYVISFIKDNSPTIGETNDTIDACGMMTGIIYDKNLNRVSNHEFHLDYNRNNSFISQDNGRYFAKALSKPTTYHWIDHIKEPETGISESLRINEINFVMEPDSVIERDIYLLDDLTTDINSLTYYEHLVKIYPNPIKRDKKLNLEIDLPVLASNIWFEINTLDGRLIEKKRIQSKHMLIDAPTESGVYILNVLLDNKVISSKKFVVKDE